MTIPSTFLPRLEAMLEGKIDIPAMIRSDERKAGYKIVKPGDEPWLSVADWKPDTVVSRKGRTVRLVLLVAVAPGKGGFTRTVDAIEAAGLAPVVVAPTDNFAATLKRHGWRCRTIGDGLYSEQQYRRAKERKRAHKVWADLRTTPTPENPNDK